MTPQELATAIMEVTEELYGDKFCQQVFKAILSSLETTPLPKQEYDA